MPADWHGMLIAMLAGNDPSSLWDNMIYGAVYFLPIYAVVFAVGGFWKYSLLLPVVMKSTKVSS